MKNLSIPGILKQNIHQILIALIIVSNFPTKTLKNHSCIPIVHSMVKIVTLKSPLTVTNQIFWFLDKVYVSENDYNYEKTVLATIGNT